MRYSRATIVGVVVMSALFALYLFFALRFAIGFMASGTVGGVLLGVGIAVLPLVGCWALISELRFGAQSTALVERLSASGPLPTDGLAVSPSGRFDRAGARELVSQYEYEAQEDERAWEPWLRLSLVYDAAGRRGDARRAAVRAIRASRRID